MLRCRMVLLMLPRDMLRVVTSYNDGLSYGVPYVMRHS